MKTTSTRHRKLTVGAAVGSLLLPLAATQIAAPAASAASVCSLTGLGKSAQTLTVGSDQVCELKFGDLPGGLSTVTHTWTVPDGVTSIDFIVVGAGGGGGGGNDSKQAAGGGGGGGDVRIQGNFTVAPGSTIDIVAGAAGEGGVGTTGANGTDGAASSLSDGTTTTSALGGNGGKGGDRSPDGGASGSGNRGGFHGSTTPDPGGGGGGVNTVGLDGTGGVGGAGGNSEDVFQPAAAPLFKDPGPIGFFGGGGGGGAASTGTATNGGLAGQGGGAGGRVVSQTSALQGAGATGSGGGGGGGAATDQASEKGGDGRGGVVLIRFIMPAAPTPPAPPAPDSGGSSSDSPAPEPAVSPSPVVSPVVEPVASVVPVEVALAPALPGSNPNIPAGGVPLGGSVFLVNGAPVPVTVAPDAPRNASGLEVTGDGFTMRLVGQSANGRPLGVTPDGALILEQDRTALTEGTGFQPNSEVRLYVFSTPRFLGTIMTDASGSFRGTVPLPLDIAAGRHTLQSNGFAPDGAVRSLSLGVQVTKPAARPATRTAKATVYFAPLSAQLDAAARKALRELARGRAKDTVRIVAVGFVQASSTTANDRSLSLARAKAVATYLKSIGVKGTIVTRGDGIAQQSGAAARKATVTLTYRP